MSVERGLEPTWGVIFNYRLANFKFLLWYSSDITLISRLTPPLNISLSWVVMTQLFFGFVICFPLSLSDAPLMLSFTPMPISHSPSLHWALSITFPVRPESLYLLFLSSLYLPAICLSLSLAGEVMGWWVGRQPLGVCHAAQASLTSHHLLQPSISINAHRVGSQSPPQCFRPTCTHLHWMSIQKCTSNLINTKWKKKCTQRGVL